MLLVRFTCDKNIDNIDCVGNIEASVLVTFHNIDNADCHIENTDVDDDGPPGDGDVVDDDGDVDDDDDATDGDDDDGNFEVVWRRI